MSIIYTKRGFTLIELMVAVSIFAMVMTMATGATLTVISQSKQSRAMQAVVTNLNFAIETMSRNLRYGKDYSEVVESTGPCINFFSELEGGYTKYCFDSGNGVITKNGVDITSKSEVNITDANFPIINKDSKNLPIDLSLRPLIKIFIKGEAIISPTYKVPFTVQTMVSSRSLNQTI